MTFCIVHKQTNPTHTRKRAKIKYPKKLSHDEIPVVFGAN